MNEAKPIELTFTRLLNAPRELVFKVWTDEQHMAKWWGPKDFTNPVCDMDVRPGGELYIEMTAPDGTLYPNKGIFHEVSEPGKLVFTTTAFEDADGEPGIVILNTVTFDDESGKTRMTLVTKVVKLRHDLHSAAEGMKNGWNQSLDRMELVAESL